VKTPPPAGDSAASGNASMHDSRAATTEGSVTAPASGQEKENGPSGDSMKADSAPGRGQDNVPGKADSAPGTTDDNASVRDTRAGADPASGRGPDAAQAAPGTDEETAGSGQRNETEPFSNGKENQVVHTRSVSIKGVLKGKPRTVPVADEAITENDQVDKAVPEPPGKVEVTEEMIQQAWKAYAASIEKSHPRIYTTLSQQVPRLTEKGIIRISLATEAQRENFIHRIKPDLTRYFQKTIAEVTYVFETDLLDNETTVKKVYTDQDKLDYLVNKNPDLDKLKSRFNLDFDN